MVIKIMNKNITDNKNFLKSYLDYYQTLNEPGYAVLITGEWGVGKTHQITQAIPKENMFYVSLFGLTSPEEIYSSIFIKMFPIQGNIKKISGFFGNSSVKHDSLTLSFGGLASNLANALIKEKVNKEKVIIFDDLERCSIEIGDILGVINKYVEHHKCRVIVIAHDLKIQKELSEKEEKIFGQKIKIRPETEKAFAYFLKTCNAPSAIQPIKDIIFNVFQASDCKSLRILKHTINDCARLISVLEYKHVNNSTVMEEIFILFTALIIQFRQSGLVEEDLQGLDNLSLMSALNERNGKEEDKPKLILLKEKYAKCNINFNYESDLLNENTLIDIIIHGYIEKNEIQKCINSSNHFKKESEIRPWYKIIKFDTSEREYVEEAIIDMRNKIANMEITERGEILHSFNLLFMLSSANEIEESHTQLLNDAIRYIKKLQYNNKLPALTIEEILSYDESYPGWNGHAYWVQEEYRSESERLNKILDMELKISFRKKYPEFISELMNALKNDVTLFCSLISRDASGVGKYFNIDLLSYIKPYEFTDAWLNTKKENWPKIRRALRIRYDSGNVHNYLSNEVSWYENVKMNLRHRASQSKGLDQMRISRLIPR